MTLPETATLAYVLQQRVRRFLGWLVLAFLSLAAGNIVAEIVYLLFFLGVGSQIYDMRSRTFVLLSLTPKSIIAGFIVASVVGYYWKPPIRVADWRWLLLNALCMSIGNLIISMTLDWVRHYAYPIAIWVIVVVSIGILFGGVQWLFLRRRTPYAGWWIPAIASNWTILWLLAWFLSFLLSD